MSWNPRLHACSLGVLGLSLAACGQLSVTPGPEPDAAVDVPVAVDLVNPGGDVEQPDVRFPDVIRPDVPRADVQLPDVQLPDVQLPDVQFPDVQRPDVQFPDVPFVPDVPMFVSAPHEMPPEIVSSGGPVLSAPQVVVITFSNDPERDYDDQMMEALVASDWLPTVAGEYGVGQPTLLRKVRLNQAAPRFITSTQLEQNLQTRIQDGTLPPPGNSALSPVLYMVFFPATTSVQLLTDGSSAQSCAEFYGFHNEFQVPSSGGVMRQAAYAVMASCSTGATLERDLSVTASHELAEAATDPLPFSNPGWLMDYNSFSSFLLLGAEVTDLCLDMSIPYGPYEFSRSWSGVSSRLGLDPCIPVPPPIEPYYNLSVTPSEIQLVTAGQHLSLPVVGWSAAPVADWQVVSFPYGSFTPTVSLNRSTFNNGVTGTVDIDIPAGVFPGTYATVLLVSSRGGDRYHYWPIGLYVQ